MCVRLAKLNSTVSARSAADTAQRQQMIAVAAYFRAERRGFIGGDPNADWLEAEAEINRAFRPEEPDVKSGAIPRQFFQEKLEAQLKEWDGKLVALEQRAQELKTKTRTEYKRQLAGLSDKRDELRDRLMKLRKSSEAAWEDMKDGAEKVSDELRESFDRIAARFK